MKRIAILLLMLALLPCAAMAQRITMENGKRLYRMEA